MEIMTTKGASPFCIHPLPFSYGDKSVAARVSERREKDLRAESALIHFISLNTASVEEYEWEWELQPNTQPEDRRLLRKDRREARMVS